MKRPSIATALPIQTVINDYTIAKVHHRGGFSWVYKAWGPDAKSVLLKEYFPHSLCFRERDGSVSPSPGYEEAFLEGIRRFHEEARILALLRGGGVPRIQEFIHENQTFYMVFPWERGRTLSQYLRARQTPIPEEIIRHYLKDFLYTLQKIHNENLLHMDLHPANLFLRLGGRPLIVDYGSSRHKTDTFLFSGSFRMFTAGFSPPETENTRSRIGPWSDIYSVGACLRACRLNENESIYSKELVHLMRSCINPSPEKRPQSLMDPIFKPFMS